MSAYYQPQPLRLPRRSQARSTRAASFASSLAYQESSIPDVDSDTSDVETEVGRDLHTPLTSPGGPRFEDLPPSYEQVQVEAIVSRVGELGREEHLELPPPPPPFEDHVANRLTLNRLSIHNNLQDERSRTRRPRPRPQSYQADDPPPFEIQQSAEEDVLDRALRFTHPLHNTSNLESMPSARLPRPIAIPQFQSHVERAGTLAFFPSYAPTLEAFGIRAALFLAFLKGLTTVFSSLQWPDYDEDATWHLMETYLARANAVFFAPRGLMVRIVDMEGLLGALHISESRVGLRNALLRDVLRPGASEGERVEMLDPWVEPLIWEDLPTDPLPDLPPEAAAQYADEKAEARQWAALIEEEEEIAAAAAKKDTADERQETASLAPSTSSSSSKRSFNTPPSSSALSKSLPPVPPKPGMPPEFSLAHRPLPPLPGALGNLPCAVQRAATFAARAQASRTRFCPGPFPRPGPFPCVPFPTAGPLPPLVPLRHRSNSSIHKSGAKGNCSKSRSSSSSSINNNIDNKNDNEGQPVPPWAQSWTQWGTDYSKKWEDWGQQFSKRCEEYASDFGKRAVAWNRELQEKRRLGGIGLGAGLGHGYGNGGLGEWRKAGWGEARGGRAGGRVQSLNLGQPYPAMRATNYPYQPGRRRGASETGWGPSRTTPLRSVSVSDMRREDHGLQTPDMPPEDFGWYTPSMQTPVSATTNGDAHNDASRYSASYDGRNSDDEGRSDAGSSDDEWDTEAEQDSIEVEFLRRMKEIEDDATEALRKGKRSRDEIEKERVRAVVAAESARAAAEARRRDKRSQMRALKDEWSQSRAANRAARKELKGLPREQMRALRAEQRAAWRVEKDKLKAEWREARRLWREGRREERRDRWAARRGANEKHGVGADHWGAGGGGGVGGGQQRGGGDYADLPYGGVHLEGLLWVVVENLE
ncbi:hypothetical protein IWX90DRAFT_487384 [Phyllosticta citrichinensis]|uniref:Uncharacterized protein n=1 Tax=Phyllosticta citrichinensis TaxID=1130410 RepID=A0ABR1XQV0_9PEZI